MSALNQVRVMRICGFAADMLVGALFSIAWYMQWINGLILQFQVKVSELACFYSILGDWGSNTANHSTGAIASEMGVFMRYELLVSKKIDEFMVDKCNIM